MELGSILASELVRARAYRIIRPTEFPSEGEDLGASLQAARRVKADAILAVEVTEYDPYDSPRIGLVVQLLRANAAPVSARELDRIVESASWRQGLFAMTPDKAGHWIRGFESVFDSRENGTREEMAAYAKAHDGGGFPRSAEWELLAVQSEYLRFVLHAIARQVVDRLNYE